MHKNLKSVLTTRSGRKFGEGQKSYIMAEIGTNHDRDFNKAVEMIRKVAAAGVDCVKFQIYEPFEIVSERVRASAYGLDKTYGDISARKMFEEQLKTPKEWFPALKDLCHELGMDFSATIHGEHGLAWAKKIGLDVVKIASMDHSNIPFLKSLVNEVDAPILASLGMAELKDVDAIVEVLKDHKPGFGLFHCCAIYPPRPEELRLGNIPFLAERTGVIVGFSDHTIDSEAALVARSMGAHMFEKHVTLDRKSVGPDHPFACEMDELKEYVSSLKAAPAKKAVGQFGFTDPAERELVNKRNYLKSVTAKKNLPAGHIITRDDVYLVRPGTGIVPMDLEKVIGRKTKKTIESELPLQWEDLE